MDLERIVKKTAKGLKNYRSKFKRKVDIGLDTVLTVAGINIAALYGLGYTVEKISEANGPLEGALMFGTYMLWGAGQIAGNIIGVPKLAKAFKKWHKRRGPVGLLSYAKTLAAAGTVLWVAYSPGFQNKISDMSYDWKRSMQAFSREDERQIELAQDEMMMDITPNELEAIIPQYLAGIDILETRKSSTRGRFLRTLRWDKVISDTEKRYNIPEGLLAGLAMRESHGNPLELNSGGDGGAGLFMFQPGTARHVGLKIYGSSTRTGRDRHHGDRLRNLVRKYAWDYQTLAGVDERFDVVKSTDKAAEYLVGFYNRFGNWDKALSAYNRGPRRVARNPMSTTHVRMTKLYQRYYLQEKYKLGQSIDQQVLAELEAQNGFDFKYIRKNSEGRSVFEYSVAEGDNATLVASNFNRWDKKRGDKYQETRVSDVVDSKKTS